MLVAARLSSKCPPLNVLYTDRDQQIHEALRLTPLDAQQL